ncbi:hypothetical protein Dimus_017387 [Dionaea muscipula]
MLTDSEIEEKKEAAKAVMDQYSAFVLACVGYGVRPCVLRMHLMKEISAIPSTLKRYSFPRADSPDPMAETSSSGTARVDKTDSSHGM